MVTSLWDMAVMWLGTATVLAQTASPLPQLGRPLPGSGRLFTDTSSTLVLQPFAADPTAAQAPPSKVQLEAFIYNQAQCAYAGQPLWYRLYVGNTGSGIARSVNIQWQYPAETSVLAADPEAERRDDTRRFLEWSVAALPARGGYAQYSVTLQVRSAGPKQSVLIVTYLDETNQVKQVVTTHTMAANCVQPDAPTRARGDKLPAIYCDPAETSCVQSFPTLGVRFGLGVAKPPLGNDKPVLGARFQEAVANILPGDCRVAADDVIVQPEYHDALNRLYNPADFYIQPLYESGLDGKRLVHEDNLLGTGFTKQAREKLYDLHTRIWREHVDIIAQAKKGVLTGQRAQAKLEALLSRWQATLDNLQAQLRVQYGQMQSSRATKFQPVADKAIENARASIQRACNTDSDGGLAQKLPEVRQVYEQALGLRGAQFAQTQLQFRNLTAVAGIWQQQLYPALQAYDDGRAGRLETYLDQQGTYAETLFRAAFGAYIDHQSNDLAALEKFRLEAFEKALDAPKTAATACEKEKVFRQPVETTFCESSDVSTIPQVLGPQASQARGRNSDARPPETMTEEQSREGVAINPEAVKGKACAPTEDLPGAPWWSKGCECKCNDQVTTLDATGNITTAACQDVYEIVRHDTAVESQAECFAQAEHHGELYF